MIIYSLSGVDILTLVITAILFILAFVKFKLNRKQINMFLLTTFFWTAIKLIRSFRTVYANDLHLDPVMVAAISGAYGLISIFVRLPLGAFSDIFKNRMWFVRIATIAIMITSFMTYFNPGYYSLLYSSYMMGLGASVWGLMNVMFAETFEGDQSLAAVATLSIAPLLADYIAAPLQSIARTADLTGNIWLYSAIAAIVTFIFSFFVKEGNVKFKQFSWNTLKHAIQNKRLLIVSLIGLGVLFIKFASSGTNAQQYAVELNMTPYFEGYLATMFSLPQLIAGVLVGVYFREKLGVMKTLMLGLGLTLIFTITVGLVQNRYLFFFVYSLNGFGYGLTYNVLLATAMKGFDVSERGTTMGFYQSIIAIGIYFGGKLSTKYSQMFGSYHYIFLSLAGITLIFMILLWISIRYFNIDYQEE